VNADKTDYIVLCRDQTAGRRHSVEIESSPF
jgi:hypothetical protein